MNRRRVAGALVGWEDMRRTGAAFTARNRLASLDNLPAVLFSSASPRTQVFKHAACCNHAEGGGDVGHAAKSTCAPETSRTIVRALH